MATKLGAPNSTFSCEKMVGLLEQYAKEKLSAHKLLLVARTYNPMALKCYTKCGFQEYSREETLIRMSKVLASE